MNIGEAGWRPSEVHPLAALFPMLDEDDLAALADDIKQHGLLHPIHVDADGRLVDGRNRLAACDKAGVEPLFSVLNGEDVEALIWSANGKRRHMSKGQLAMIAAMGMDLPEAGRSGSDQGQSKAARAAGVSRQRIQCALLVREHAPHMVTEVIGGSRTLDAVYAVAQENKRQHDRLHDGLNTLRKQDKDLAQKVSDREMTVDQAFAEIDRRKRERAAQRDSVLLGISSGVGSLVGFEASEVLPEVIADLRTEEGQEHLARYFKGGVKELGEKLMSAKRGLAALERAHKQINGRE